MMKIRIPNSWKDIRVDKFPLIYDIVRDSDIDENERNYRVLSILADVNLSDIKKIKLSELKKLIDSIQYIFKFEFPKHKQTFKHNKIHYKINYDVTQLNAEDFITLSKLTENEDTIINNLPHYRQLVGQYRGLFGKPVSRSDEDTEPGTDERTEEQKHTDYWGWYVTLDLVSKEDRTKWDFYLKMNVIAFLNYLSYLKDKNKWQSSQQNN